MNGFDVDAGAGSGGFYLGGAKDALEVLGVFLWSGRGRADVALWASGHAGPAPPVCVSIEWNGVGRVIRRGSGSGRIGDGEAGALGRDDRIDPKEQQSQPPADKKSTISDGMSQAGKAGMFRSRARVGLVGGLV